MGWSHSKQRSLFLLIWTAMCTVLALNATMSAQVRCPSPAEAAADYGTACDGQVVLLGGSVTSMAMAGNQVPGNASASEHRVAASTSPGTTTRLSDERLQALLTAGRQAYETQLADLVRHFGSQLNYCAATGGTPTMQGGCVMSTADQFISQIITPTEEARNYFLAAAISHPENSTAVNGLLDSMNLLAQRWIIRGNQQLADALYRRYQETGFTLLDVIRGLESAEQSFRNATDVFMAQFYRPLALSVPTSQGTASTLYELALYYQPGRRDPYTRMPFRDLRLLAQAAGRKAFAQRERGERLFAMGTDYNVTLGLLTGAELEILGELIIAAALYESVTTPAERLAVNEALRELVAERSEINTLLRYLEGGKNVLGLEAGYVPFIYDSERPGSNNFNQVRFFAEDMVGRGADPGIAGRSYRDFLDQHREFERSVTDYRNRVMQHQQFYSREISSLCGSTDPANCTGGLLRQARQDIEQANLSVTAVLRDIRNLQARTQNALEANDEIAAISDQLAQMEISDGNRRANLLDELGALQAAAARAQAAVEADRARATRPAECDPPPPPMCERPEDCTGSGEALQRCREERLQCRSEQQRCQALADMRRAGDAAADAAERGGRISADLARQTGQIQARIERLQALQRAEFTRLQDRQRTASVREFVKNTTLDILSREIDLMKAELARTQAAARLEDLNQQLRLTLAERRVWQNLDTTEDVVFQDPTLRIIRDESLKKYMSDYKESLRRVYQAGLALAYEINLCPGRRCPPPQRSGAYDMRDPDSLLRLVDISALREKLVQMNDLLINRELVPIPEVRPIVVSLSRLLGFKKGVFDGAEKTAKQQFGECLRALVERQDRPPGCPDAQYMEGSDPGPPDPETGVERFRTVTFRFPIDLSSLEDFGDPDYAPPISPRFANARIRSIKARIEGPDPREGEVFDLPLDYGLFNSNGNLIGAMAQRGMDASLSFTDPNGDVIRRYNAPGAGRATLSAEVGDRSFDRIPNSSNRFIYRTLGFSNYVLTLSVNPQQYPRNPDLIRRGLGTVADITFEFTCEVQSLQ